MDDIVPQAHDFNSCTHYWAISNSAITLTFIYDCIAYIIVLASIMFSYQWSNYLSALILYIISAVVWNTHWARNECEIFDKFIRIDSYKILFPFDFWTEIEMIGLAPSLIVKLK